RDRAARQRDPSALAEDLARGRGCARELFTGDRPARHGRRIASGGPAPAEPCRRGGRALQARADARARHRACPMVRAVRQQSRDRDRLLGRANLSLGLCDGAADGRRRTIAGADHHAADDASCDHHADRDRAVLLNRAVLSILRTDAQRPYKPVNVALARVWKCRSNPTSAAEAESFLASGNLSTSTAKTVIW